MRWTRGGMSGNIEDRRGGGFGGGGLRVGLGGMLVLIVLSIIFGRDFLSLVSAGPATNGSGYSTADRNAANEPVVQFVSFVLDDAQQTWHGLMPQYQDAKLVLFDGVVQSACGMAQSATGPFYCPADSKVYLDTSFFDELDRRFGAPGDFAQAYVIAHEIGHHVQNLLGITGRAGSVPLELQADCLAGVWGHSTAQRDILEKGDIEEGLNAAAAIGDDRLSQGRASPDSFTHGSSAQRVYWFKRGLDTGKVSACDTSGAGQ